MIKIITRTQNTSLPFSIIKGSAQKRNKTADALSKQFYTKLLSASDDKSCTLEIFNVLLNNLLQNIINFKVLRKTNPKYRGTIKHNVTGTECDDNGIISLLVDGFKIFLPLDKNGKNITNKFCAIHEARHLFDAVCNPKTNQFRLQNLYEKIDFEAQKDNISKLFLDTLDNPIRMKDFKSSVRKLIEDMPDTISIDCLQTIRNSLKSEINAYGDEIKSMAKGSGLFYNLREILTIKLFLHQNAKFKQKLKFANKLLKEKLTNARNNHRMSLNS